MRALVDFIWLAVRCIAFIWAVTTVLILILFVVGTEAEGYNWGERLIIAIKYAGYIGGIFGSLLAVYLWWQSWKTNRRNKKVLSKRESSKAG